MKSRNRRKNKRQNPNHFNRNNKTRYERNINKLEKIIKIITHSSIKNIPYYYRFIDIFSELTNKSYILTLFMSKPFNEEIITEFMDSKEAQLFIGRLIIDRDEYEIPSNGILTKAFNHPDFIGVFLTENSSKVNVEEVYQDLPIQPFHLN